MNLPRLLILYLFAAALLFGGCDSHSGWEGSYVSPDTDFPVTLTLHADGKGMWINNQESTPIRWEKRQGALWLHIRTGGVLIAAPLPDRPALHVTLPDGKKILLEKKG